jgi:hypothetical protein
MKRCLAGLMILAHIGRAKPGRKRGTDVNLDAI